MSNKIYIQKSKFLELVNKVYGQYDLDYLLRLSQALMIIYKIKKDGSDKFTNYDGFIEL